MQSHRPILMEFYGQVHILEKSDRAVCGRLGIGQLWRLRAPESLRSWLTTTWWGSTFHRRLRAGVARNWWNCAGSGWSRWRKQHYEAPKVLKGPQQHSRIRQGLWAKLPATPGAAIFLSWKLGQVTESFWYLFLICKIGGAMMVFLPHQVIMKIKIHEICNT